MAKEKQKRAAGSSTTRNKISVRVTSEQYDQLIREAGGKNYSKLVHERIFAQGVPQRSLLRQVAALHMVGMRLKMLADHPAAAASDVEAALADTRAAILKLSGQLP